MEGILKQLHVDWLEARLTVQLRTVEPNKQQKQADIVYDKPIQLLQTTGTHHSVNSDCMS